MHKAIIDGLRFVVLKCVIEGGGCTRVDENFYEEAWRKNGKYKLSLVEVE